ncbi:MAG TPA: SRPBCC family protein [Gemmatimonadaceae bacterium]
MASSSDRIEKQIEIDAPVSRVWQAITDYREFGEWFRVSLESPFVEGQKTAGNMTNRGYEKFRLEVLVKSIVPESHFSYYWHPYAIDLSRDYSGEPMTLVEFNLAPTDTGTLLTISESGFDAIPAERRDEAYRMDTKGWEAQINNIKRHVTGNA